MASNHGFFRDRYGPWALVTGGSEGLGAEFARQLAGRGLDLILVARRLNVLRTVSAEIRRDYGVKVEMLRADLADPRGIGALLKRVAKREVGLFVANAALSAVGPFLSQPAEVHRRTIGLNCLAVALLAHALGQRMAERGRGGMILVSSMAGFQGTSRVVHYAATKAYLRVLAEGLWVELKPLGVDVLACCAGPIDTPTYRRENPRQPGWLAVPVMKPDGVVKETLEALGCQPVVVPGLRNRLASAFTQRVLPKRLAVWLASAGTEAMYAGQPSEPSR